MSTLIIILIFLFVAMYAVSSLSKSAQKVRGRHRCEACGSRLKAVGGRYMPVCRKCSHRQSWAG